MEQRKPIGMRMKIEPIRTTMKIRNPFKEKWYMWVCYFCFTFLGIFLLWYNQFYSYRTRVLLTVGAFLYMFLILVIIISLPFIFASYSSFGDPFLQSS
ncbi:MAG TPA: hypothetical protein DDY49_00055 [Paenibacillaceae bacterium]|nr:hypothetical protein [Paenibacillaceae bacterium]